MAGIYIHIPFCKKKCAYCNFFSVANSKYIDETIECIGKEIILNKNFFENSSEKVDTIYFGGGTPSLINPYDIAKIIEIISTNFNLSDSPEITLEANPDDINKNYIKELLNIGINRLSIGIQSFNEDDLKYLGRIHNSSQGEYAIKISQDTGFTNISIDLIYGISQNNCQTVKSNIETFLELQLNHLSAYCLTIEENTLLARKIAKNTLKLPSEEIAISEFLLLMDILEKHGFLHYEISNWAKPNFMSKHNMAYWQQIPYLGIGPSAHSYINDTRKWNVSDVLQYLKGIYENKPIFEFEKLTTDNKYNEYVMLGLRTMNGCSLNEIKNSFGSSYYDHFINELQKINSEFYQKINNNDVVILTKKGKLLADNIAEKLFVS